MRVRADTRVEIGDERLALYSADAISLPPIAGELMPHLVLRGTVDFQRAATELDLGVIRWGRAVIKTSDAWKRCRTAADYIAAFPEMLSGARPTRIWYAWRDSNPRPAA